MIEEIKKLFEKKDRIPLSKLKKMFKAYGDFEKLDELTNSLSLLENDGICFFDIEDNNVHRIDSNYIFAQVQTSKKGCLFIDHKGKHIVIDEENRKWLLPFDTVVFDKDLNIVKIVNRKINTIVLESVRNGKKKGVKVIGNPDFACYLHNASINAESKVKALDLPEGTRFTASLGSIITSRGYQADFKEIISHRNDFDSDLMAIAYNNGFRVLHTPEEMKQVYDMPTEVLPEDTKNREDYRDDEIFTIDGIYTKDIDDAVGIEILPNGNYLLKVFIADVAHYVEYGSPLWKRAEENTTSLYLANKVSHMLHYIVSNGICSLNEGEDRLAKGYFTEISPEGKIIYFDYVDAVINSKKKMTYDDVNLVLEQGIIPDGYENHAESLNHLNNLAKILAKKRKNEGAICIDNSEVSFKLNEEDEIEKIELQKQHSAEHLIEQLMIITNEAVAEYMMNMGITFVYRNHAMPSALKVDELKSSIKKLGYQINNLRNNDDPLVIQRIINGLKTKEEFFVLVSMILKTLPRAYYSTENRGHFGLASSGYSQCTSPIRRFLDLIIETVFNNIEYFYSEECNVKEIKRYLNTMCERASMMERMADKCEYEAEKLRMCEYIKQKAGETLEAYVYSVKNNKIIVKTKEEHIEGVVLQDDLIGTYEYVKENNSMVNSALGRVIKLGTPIYVQFKFSDIEHREIYFSQAERSYQRVLENFK